LPATAPKKLTTKQARAIGRAHSKRAELKRQLETADAEWETIRGRYRHLIPTGELVAVGGVRIKVTKKNSGPSFKIAKFLEQHKLTPQMRPFMGGNTPYDNWDVKVTEDVRSDPGPA
jgi:hypothetical protein